MTEDGPLQLGLRSPKHRSASLSSAGSSTERELPPLPDSEVPVIREPLRPIPGYTFRNGRHQRHGNPPQLAAHSIAAANDRGKRERESSS